MFPILLSASPPASAADLVTEQLYQGNLPAALEAARSDAEASPSNLDAQELYIDLMLASGRAGTAAQTYGARVKRRPTDPDAHYLLGRALVRAEDAAGAYERALRLDPDHARSHMGMGAVHTAEGDLGKAEAAYRAALQRDGTLGEAWLGLVRVWVLMGNPEGRALEIAKRGLVADPDEAGLALTVATLDPANARAVLQQATKTTRDARIHVRLAELQLSAGDTAAAEASARKAKEIDPGNGDAERLLVFARTIQAGSIDLEGLSDLFDARDLLAEDPAAAARATDALAERYPDAAVVLLARAEAWDKAGDREKALESLSLTLQRDPEMVDAQAAFGLALVRGGRFEEAIPWLLKAVVARSWDPALVRSLGLAQLRAGKVEDAVTTLRSANRTRPWDVPTTLIYAESLQQAGEPDAAYALVRDALRKEADPRLAAAFVIAAQAAGHGEAAAEFLEDLGRKSGSAKLLELARKIRADAG